MTMRERQRDRQTTNPAFSTRRLKLGTFQTNLDSGCVMSDLDGRLDITWANTVELAKLSADMEFEALVPVARWHGWGGKTNPQGPGFEAYTWAAGIAASVPKVGVVSTSHITINHPIIAAKQSAVIDHISDGALHSQRCHRLGAARDRDVWPADARPRGPLRLRRGMARHHQAAVDRGRLVRPRRPLLQDQEGLSGAEADPVPLSRDHERRRLRARPALCGEELRSGVYRDPHRRPGGMHQTRPGLSRARTRVRPRHQGLDARQHRAGRDREGSPRLLRLLRPPAGRLGRGE